MQQSKTPKLDKLRSKLPLSKKMDPHYQIREGEIEIMKEFDLWEYYKDHQEGVDTKEPGRYAIGKFAQRMLKHHAIGINLFLNGEAHAKKVKTTANSEPPDGMIASCIDIRGALPEDERNFKDDCLELRDYGKVLIEVLMKKLSEKAKLVKHTMEEISHIPQSGDDFNKRFDFVESARVSFLRENAKGYSTDILKKKIDIAISLEAIKYIQNDFNDSDCVKKEVKKEVPIGNATLRYSEGFLYPIQYPEFNPDHSEIYLSGNYLYNWPNEALQDRRMTEQERLDYQQLLELQYENYWDWAYQEILDIARQNILQRVQDEPEEIRQQALQQMEQIIQQQEEQAQQNHSNNNYAQHYNNNMISHGNNGQQSALVQQQNHSEESSYCCFSGC